jgi:hypothetical protein
VRLVTPSCSATARGARYWPDKKEHPSCASAAHRSGMLRRNKKGVRPQVMKLCRRNCTVGRMGAQAAVIFRCRVCRRLRPAVTPPALGCVERGPDGILRPYRLQRVGQPLQPFMLDTSPLGDARWALDPLPGSRTARLHESWHQTLRLPCRVCRRAPAQVEWEPRARRALAQGLSEVDV